MSMHKGHVTAEDERRAASAYQSALATWGERNMVTQRAELRYAEIKARRLAQRSAGSTQNKNRKF